MKIQRFKSALLIGVFLSVTGIWAHAEELKKEFHEEFPADENTQLVLQNKYGSIDVQNWENQKIKIDVEVIVNHSNSDRAEKLLSYIDVNISANGNTVKAVTSIDDKFGRSRSDDDFEINYTVQMPRQINLDLTNKYGHVSIDEVAGLANIDVRYGKLTVNNLSRGNIKPINTVNLAYASGSSITECNWLKANIKYSGLSIEQAKAFVGYTSYMKLSIDEVSSVVIDGKYDGYTFGKVSNLVIKTSYSSIKADEITKKLEADSKYTNFNIDHMPAEFESINISSSYGKFNIGLDEDASYNLEGKASYSKIYYNEGEGRVSRIQENTSMTVSGTVGSDSNPTATVDITTRYGNVRLED